LALAEARGRVTPSSGNRVQAHAAYSNQIKPLNLVDQSQEPRASGLDLSHVRSITSQDNRGIP